MRYVLPFILVFAPVSVLAQQFQIIRVDYTTSHSIQDSLGVVRIDSILINGQDTIYYFHPVTTPSKGLPGNCSIKTDSIPWMGEQVTIHGKTNNLFVNKDGEIIDFDILFIVPEFNFGASDIIYTFSNGDRMRATVVGDEYVQKHGVYLRTKTLQLAVEDGQGNSVAHPMNGKDIVIHEKFGFEKIYSMWEFPNDTTPILIEGNARYNFGATGMKAHDIFNIQPGHERHYLTNYEMCGFPGCRRVETREKLFTLARDTSANGDTLWITHQRTSLKFIDDPVTGLDTTYEQDTFVQEIPWADWQFLDHFPNEWFNYAPNIDGYSIAYKTDTTGPRFIKKLILDYTYDAPNNCLAPNIPANNLPEWRFGDGLGISYFKHDTSGFSTIEKELVYYQRGIEKWGDPFQFGQWTGDEPTPWQALRMYPNPATAQITITGLPIGEVDIVIMAMDGRQIVSIKESGSTARINVSSLPAGVYLVRVHIGGGFKTFKLIKT